MLFSDQNVILLWIRAAEWFTFWSWFFFSFIESTRIIFHFCADFHVSLDQQDFHIRSHVKSSWMIFHFGHDFHVSLGPQICRFRLPLRAAEQVSTLVLIFMFLQISKFADRVPWRAAEWVFILVLIVMYLQISRFADLELHWEQLKVFYIGPDFHLSSNEEFGPF